MNKQNGNFLRTIRLSIDNWMKASLKPIGIISFGEHFIYATSINSSSVVIDLGANVGSFSKKIYHHFQSKLFLVEPNLRLLDRINMPEGVKINAVISNKPGPLIFYISNNPEASSLDKNIAEAAGIIEEKKIQSISFSKILSTYNLQEVDLLKVDIEGAELELLNEMKDEDLIKCKQISVEFHDFLDPSHRAIIKNITNKFIKKGYYVFKTSTINYGCMLFIKKSVLKLPFIPMLKFNLIYSLAFIVDKFYYSLLLPYKKHSNKK